MARYVFRNGRFVEPATGTPMPLPYEGMVCAPNVVPDTPGYASPITGEWIEGRKARREDLKKHGCIEAGDFKPTNGGRVRNEKFARKHGLRWIGD